jgi:Mn2+/Fe2+ NRAMP family transporter
VSKRLAPLQETEMPKREKAFWQMTGPGAIMVGLSIGAGELMLWPWITAKFGADMAWAAMLGLFLQMWINLEIGRWVIATGESPYTSFARQWRGFVYIFLMFNIILSFLPAWALSSGLALKAMLLGPDHDSPGWLWTAITFAGLLLVMFGPKMIYNAIEKSIAVMVAIIVIGLVIVMVQVGTFDTFVEMGRGMINVPHIETDDEFPISRFFGAIVFAGAGGMGNLFYAFYLRDKGIGMGARVPKLMNPIRGQQEAAPDTGFTFAEDAEQSSRFKDWFRFVKQDQVIYFWLLNSFTMFLFMFGALAVLHTQGIVPDERNIVWGIAISLRESMGAFGQYLFLIIGMAALFSTQLTVIDGGARTFTDLFHTNFNAFKRFSNGQLYLWIVLTTVSISIIGTFIFERYDMSAASFAFVNAMINGFAMAIYTPFILIGNLRMLPKAARPGIANIVMVGIGTAVYGGFAVLLVLGLIQRIVG